MKSQERDILIQDLELFLLQQGYSKPKVDISKPNCVELALEKKGELTYFSVMTLTHRKNGWWNSTNKTELSFAIQHENAFFYVIVDKTKLESQRFLLIPFKEAIKYISKPSVKFDISIPDEDISDLRAQKYSRQKGRITLALIRRIITLFNRL